MKVNVVIGETKQLDDDSYFCFFLGGRNLSLSVRKNSTCIRIKHDIHVEGYHAEGGEIRMKVEG